MAESMVLNPEATAVKDGCLDRLGPSTNRSSSSSIVHRRIDFHPARKPFNGFGNGGGDFRLETLNPGSDSRRPPTSPAQSAKGGKRPGGLEFLENGLDPELSLGISIRKIGAGLANLGNTCFLNSVLQCLTHTEPLAAYLQSGKHQNSCRVAGFCALCAIQKHVSRALQSTGSILAPKDLVSNLRCISRNFRNARQEDAHEYMVNLLESMHKCCLPSGVPSESPGAYDKSLVHKIFGGRLRSQVKCMQCNYCSDTFDPFLDLSLEIAKADSLQKALGNFTAAEQLDGGERHYQCQKCKHKVRALKQLTVHKAPYVLTIHLKRFRAHNPGQKIDKKVHFGPTLDLKPFVSGSYEGDLKYTLYGVLVHYGFSTHSGHYYSFVRTSGGTWYNLDDNRVAAVGERTVLDQKAYMLFYVRDKRNNAPRKSVDTVQKESMKASNGGNKTAFTSKQGCSGPIQNGIVDNRANGVACSSALTRKDESKVGSTKPGYNGPVKNGTVENKSNGAACSSALTQKEVNVGSTKQSHCGSAQNASVDYRSSNGAAVLTHRDAQSVGSTKDAPLQSKDSSKMDYESGTASKAQVEPSSEATSSKGMKWLSLPNSDLWKQSQHTEYVHAMERRAETSKNDLSVSVDVFTHKETFQKSNPVSEVLPSNLVPSDKTVGKIDSGRSTDQPSHDNSPVGSMANSASSSMMNVGLNKEAHGRVPKKKLRLKLGKCHIASMRLGPNILFGALSHRKKFKKSKRHTLDSKNLSEEHLSASHCISSDLGPSTSEKTSKVSLHATSAKKRAAKSSSKGVDFAATETTNSLGDSVAEDGKVKDRNGQSGAVVAFDKQSEKVSGTTVVGNQSDATETMQNGITSLPTHGLEETFVPSWDAAGPPSHNAQSKSSETISIGYVGDEWDEEYDMGRRKKVRTFKHTFGGPNLFQEIASKKMKSKRPRTDQSCSGDQPFRI